MVLNRTLSTVALIAVAAMAAEAQRGLTPSTGGRGGFGGFVGLGSDGPRPMLIGFALECTKCNAVGRGGRQGGVFGGTGRGGGGPLAVWHYDEYPRIATIVAGSAAQRAGIRENDVLMSVDGLSILTDEGAQRFAELRGGDSVRLTLDRGGNAMSVDLVLNRGGGRGGAMVEAPAVNAPSFTTRAQGTRVDVWSDARIVQSTDSTGATILRIGSTVVRLTGDSPLGRGGGGGRGRRGGAP